MEWLFFMDPFKETEMPETQTMQRAKRKKREGKSAGSQAGEFVREEIHHVREGKHGARSTKQAIAIGLSKARRAGVDLSPPDKGKTSAKTRQSAEQDRETGQGERKAKRRPGASKSSKRALARESGRAASHEALSRQAKSSARKRTAAERSASARKAAQTRRRARSA